jgi:hypothetical protein
MKITTGTLFRFYVIVILLNSAIFTLLHFLLPQSRDFLFSEDNLVENLSALLFLCTFFAGIFFVLRLKENRHRKIYLVFPFLGLIAFLDEISFGQRIFNFKVPIVHDVPIDAIHDIIEVGYNIIIKHGNAYLNYVLLAVVFFIPLIIILKYRSFFFQIPDMLRKHPPYGYLLISMGFLFSVQTLDFEKLIRPQFIDIFLEELFEMNAALTLLVATFSIGLLNTSYEKAHKMENTFIKKFPALVGILLSCFFFVALMTYFVSYSYTKSVKEEHRKYLERVIPLIFTSWDFEVLIKNIPDDFYDKAFHPKIKKTFQDSSKRYGSFKRLSIIESKMFKVRRVRQNGNKRLSNNEEMENLIMFKHELVIAFEKASAKITVATSVIENNWRILGIKLT